MTSTPTLAGKTLLMSGGSRGIGLAIALRAARGESKQEREWNDTSHGCIPSASRASAIRLRTSAGAVPPWLARAATEASTDSAV